VKAGWRAVIGGDPAADRLLPARRALGLPLALVAAILAFLAVLAVSLGLAAGSLAADWGGPQAGTATLQIFGTGGDVEAEARAALGVLRGTPGVRGVRVIEIEEQRALLEPWFGAEIPADSLPLPLLIEVSTDGAALDRDALSRRLEADVPGAVFDDHAAIREALSVSANRLRVFAAGCLVLLAVALAAVFALGAQAAVAANAAAIRTLRLVGARDRFIGGILSRRALRQALAGAVPGALTAFALVALLPRASEPGFFLVAIGPRSWAWGLALLVPLAAALIGWLATARTLRRQLRRWT
jgi:cell division transport system permease protein